MLNREATVTQRSWKMSDNGSVGEEKVEVIARFEGEEDNNESTDGMS